MERRKREVGKQSLRIRISNTATKIFAAGSSSTPEESTTSPPFAYATDVEDANSYKIPDGKGRNEPQEWTISGKTVDSLETPTYLA